MDDHDPYTEMTREEYEARFGEHDPHRFDFPQDPERAAAHMADSLARMMAEHGAPAWALDVRWDHQYREHVYTWRRGGEVVLEGYVSGNRRDAEKAAERARVEFEARGFAAARMGATA
jgi:hypothetical protein